MDFYPLVLSSCVVCFGAEPASRPLHLLPQLGLVHGVPLLPGGATHTHVAIHFFPQNRCSPSRKAASALSLAQGIRGLLLLEAATGSVHCTPPVLTFGLIKSVADLAELYPWRICFVSKALGATK